MRSLSVVLAVPLLLCSTGFSQNMPTNPKPDPAHLGPLAPDPRIKQHPRKEQAKLSESAHEMEVDAEKATRIPAVKNLIIQPAVADVFFREKDNTIEIVNGTGMRIVGLSILIHPGAHMVLDGLDSFFDGIPPGGSMPVGISGFGDIRVPETKESYGQSYSLDWVIFEDGRFFGSERDAENLLTKAKVRHEFLENVGNRLPHLRDAYVSEILTCVDDPKCMGSVGSTAFELTALKRVAESYQRHAVRFKERTEQFLRDFSAKHAAYPRVRHVASTSKVLPASKDDGWAINTWLASCKNTPGYSTTAKGTGCAYSSAPWGSSGYGEDPTLEGFKATSTATCYNQYTHQYGRPIRSEFKHAIATVASDPYALRYVPRHRVQSRIQTNANQQAFEGWTGDTTYFAVAYGYPEKDGPTSDLNGGKTWCILFFDGPPFGIYANNTVDGYPRPGNNLPAVLLFDYNTENQTFANNYGFFIANYDEAWTCGESDPFISPYEIQTVGPGSIWYPQIPVVKNDGAHGLGVTIGCMHEGNTTAGGSTCNPTANYCCCMATYNDFGLCTETYGLVPDPIGCGGPAEAVVNTLNGGVSVASFTGLGSSIRSSKMGISRSGGSWLLDSLGRDSYVAGETTFYPAFIPPGGALSTDVPVSGDWDGGGMTKIGVFRPSTGAWYLDGNGNGTWDGVAGGDLQFQFGGGIASVGTPNTPGYIPGDVPIVGDWQGGGKDCIGVFRSGYFWITDSNCSGAYEYGDNAFAFGGILGDVPVVGKWGGYSNSQVGVVRCYIDPTSHVCAGAPYYWILDAWPANGSYHAIGQGAACGLPNPQYQAQCLTVAPFAFGGIAGDLYLSGDWMGIGKSYPGVYRGGTWIEAQDSSGLSYAVHSFGGLSGDKPLAGKW